ncbi:MAG: phosphatase PAP2 family protein [candidate division Zixibacteria bacterium]|nr:phosphatase PAP2 family protein [candidate division Zixibacteria bacterium]
MSRVKIILISSLLFIFLNLDKEKSLATECNGVNILDCAVKQLYSDGEALSLSPLHWNKKERLEFLLLATSTAGLFFADEELQRMVQRNRSDFSDDLANLATPSEHIYPKVAIGGFYLGGLIFNRKKERETAFYLLEALIFTQGITQGIKHLTGRARPLAQKGAFYFEGLKTHPSPFSLSFPSGHSATAFCLASVIAEQYDNKLIDWLSYSLATLAAWARVNDNAHFTSDVFFGGVLGHWVGKSIVRFQKGRISKKISFQTKIELNSVKVSLNF